MKQTKVIGVIGGAGCGKSELLKIFKEKYKAMIIMADDVARDLSMPGGKSYVRIVDAFGRDILGPDGTIDRKKLAELVFNDKDALARLNGIVHPDVREEIEARIGEGSSRGVPYIILEAALLVECGYRSICDEFWYVHASESVRRERMKTTRNYTDEKIDAIMRNQLSEEEFFKNCDKVIENNATIEALEKEIEKNLG